MNLQKIYAKKQKSRDSFWRRRVLFQTKVVYETKLFASKEDVYRGTTVIVLYFVTVVHV
jgi:hypothetical protein